MGELGSGSGSSYPGALDTNSALEVDDPAAGRTLVRADVPNDLGAAIVAIETELGTDPSGTLVDVKTFLQTEHATNGTHGTIAGNLVWKSGTANAMTFDHAITAARLVTFPDQAGTVDILPAGTVMVFFQAAAPTGWTQVTTQNDKALRVVSGAGAGTGGAVGLSGIVTGAEAAHTHTGPSHTHSQNSPSTTATVASPGNGFIAATSVDGADMFQCTGSGATPLRMASGVQAGGTGATGAGSSHTHTINPLYIDVIICSKN